MAEGMSTKQRYLRDTACNRILRGLTGKPLIGYQEERPDWDISSIDQYLIKPETEKRNQSDLSAQRSRGSDETAVESSDNSRAKDGDKAEKQKSEKSQQSAHDATGADKNIVVVDWYGDEDPENPQNWTTGYKAFQLFNICGLTFAIYIGSAIYTSGIQSFITYFGCSRVVATLGLSVFVFGYGSGPLLLSPISEIPQIGRLAVYLFCMFAFVLLQVGCALAPNVPSFLVLRFLSGFIGSPPLATGGATLTDMYSPRNVPFAMGIFGLANVLGPVLGPLIAGFVVQADSQSPTAWRWPFWILLAISGTVFIFLMIFFTETSSATILTRRAKRIRKATGKDHYQSQGEIASSKMSMNEIIMMTLVRPFTLMAEPIILAFNVYIAVVYAILYCWFEAFPIVYQEMHGFNLGLLGTAYIPLIIGGIIAYGIYCIWAFTYFIPKMKEHDDNIPPEVRLPISFIGAFALVICLFAFGWTASPSIHWIAPMIASSLFIIGALPLFLGALTYLADVYPNYVASVYASNDFFRSMVGGAFPIFASAMFNNLGGPGGFGVAWGSTLLGGIALLLLPVPFLLFKFGPKIRSWSKMAES